MLNKIFVVIFLILGCLLVAKFGIPQPAFAQGVPPGMEQCDLLFCSSGQPVIQFCQANTTPRCQFGCFTSGSCTNATCDANACQQSAGNTVPGHPCTGSCEANGCVTSCPYCQLGTPQKGLCGSAGGCPDGQRAYTQDWSWTNGYQGIGNGEACSSIPSQISCQPDSSCGGGGNPNPSSGTTTHLACSGNACVSVAGAGSDSCTTSPNSCGGPVTGCSRPTNPNPPPGCTGGLCCALCGDGIQDTFNGENAGNCPADFPSGGGGGGGGSPGGCSLNNGESCGAGVAGCCASGLTCNSSGGTARGTCRGAGGGVCKLPQAHLIYPIAADSTSVATIPSPNLIYGSGTNPEMKWTTDGDNTADCTFAHDALYAYLFIDNQAVQYIQAPGYNPSRWQSFPNDPSWVPSGATRITTNANSIDTSMTTTPGTYTAPFTPVPGVIHTWNVQFLSSNGNFGGQRDANNWNLGRFIITGGPPTPICQTDARDPYNDLCDVPSPLSYAGVTRHAVSVLDNGSSSTTFLHNFTIIDDTNPAAPPIQINNVPGIGGSVVSAPIPVVSLTLGHTYEWFVSSTDPNNGQILTQTAPHWHFVYDTVGPVVTPNMTYGKCYAAPQGPNNPPPLKLFVSDTGSGVKSVSVTISDNGALSNIPLAFDPTSPGNPNSGYYTAAWSGLATGHTYSILAGNATDNGGNATTAPIPNSGFLYSTVCTSPWLQTQQGDVHSNINVNTPGGP